ncbi:MAG: hypothetical protein AB7E49_08130 [Campylobacterales bacterium]
MPSLQSVCAPVRQGKSFGILDQESQELSQTLLRIEALCERQGLPKSAEALGRAQEMIDLLQQRIERLQRISRSL